MFYKRVYRLVRQIPAGQVATYGQIAALLGNPRAARAVGWALHRLPDGEVDRVPWHRVINAQGRISTSCREHPAHEQRRRLEREGIVFDGTERVPLERYRWDPPPEVWSVHL
jgi:methylated-DNA-protein-cysteine methyltransferase-like protein